MTQGDDSAFSRRESTKSDWRAMLRTATGQAAASSVDVNQRVCRALEAFLKDRVPPGRRVVVYDALPSEIDLSALIAACSEPGRRFCVTRTPDEGFELTVHQWGGPVERHRYGYLQPQRDASVVDDGDIGAVLVPALAFDVSGNRLGRGKGYYDRFLARLLALRGPSATPALVGIAGSVVADELPHDDHDVAMTHLALTSGVWSTPVADEGLARVERLGIPR